MMPPGEHMNRMLPTSILALLLCASCARRQSPDDSWRNDWDVIANAVESNLNVAGHIPLGWHDGEIDQTVVNRPPYEGRGRHSGIFVLHPISINEPARLLLKKSVPVDRPVLVVTAAGNVNGDCLLRCTIDGRPAGEYRLTGTEWTTCRFDLSGVVGSAAVVELQNVAGGEDTWRFEHCFIDDARFEPR